jgi:FeS assembly protein IscX
VTWRDIGEIAERLRETHPDVDPLQVHFGELRQLVAGLPGFRDDPGAASDDQLEAVQEAWYDLSEG